MTASHKTAHHAIVFDLGGVVVDWQPRYVYETIFADKAELDYFLKEVCNGPWMLLTDGGSHDWRSATAELVAKFPHYRAQIEAFRPRWGEMLRGEIADSVAILEALKAQGQRLLALTNWAADTFDEGLPRLPSLSLFEAILVSGREKLGKPDPAIFHLLCRRHGVDPARSIYIDDNRANVDAAARLGFDALFFSSPAQLAADLTQRGALRG
ncbi:MAG: HAD family hydrolase [Reyranellaceae bacterium]